MRTRTIQPVRSAPKELLTRKEAAEFFGVKVGL